MVSTDTTLSSANNGDQRQVVSAKNLIRLLQEKTENYFYGFAVVRGDEEPYHVLALEHALIDWIINGNEKAFIFYTKNICEGLSKSQKRFLLSDDAPVKDQRNSYPTGESSFDHQCSKMENDVILDVFMDPTKEYTGERFVVPLKTGDAHKHHRHERLASFTGKYGLGFMPNNDACATRHKKLLDTSSVFTTYTHHEAFIPLPHPRNTTTNKIEAYAGFYIQFAEGSDLRVSTQMRMVISWDTVYAFVYHQMTHSQIASAMKQWL